ncbi:MAG: M20 family metallopeptidase [Magnetococcales bacterium]|nr:M20 family metallopeptidase [Magnetococcales bacterium]
MDPVQLTRTLLAIDTRNPPGNELDCANHLAGLLEAGGLEVRCHPLAPRRASLSALLPGRDDDPPLCFTGHLDTVPLGETPWQRDPFAGEIDGDLLYGRGATDMKSGLAAMVWAVLEVARGRRGRRGIRLIMTADEEVGCGGSRALVGDAGALGTAGALVVAEPTGNQPLLGHKGALWLKVLAQGRAAHGSMPGEGDNAIYKIARAALALERFDFAHPPHPLLGSPTLNVGTVQGGTRVNIVPDRAELAVDIRILPDQDPDRLLEQVAVHLGPEVTVQGTRATQGVMSDPTDPWLTRVVATAQGHGVVLGDLRTAPYVTDASVLTPALGGPPTVILGPGEFDQAHKTDEYCLISRIRQAADIYLDLCRDWVGG